MRLILSVVKSLINFQFQALLFTVQYNIQKYRIPRKRARFGQRKWAFWTSLFKFVHFVWKFRRSRNNKLHIIVNVMTSQLRYACHKHIYNNVEFMQFLAYISTVQSRCKKIFWESFVYITVSNAKLYFWWAKIYSIKHTGTLKSWRTEEKSGFY